MKLVIDTNALISSLSSKSKYHWLIQWLRASKYQLCVSSEIYLEYEEKLKEKYNPVVAEAFLNSLKELSNVIHTEIFYNWNLIYEDPDDNKFVDCAFASNVDFIITNDKHFNILKKIDFPSINVIKLEDFEIFCEGGLIEQTIHGKGYKIDIKGNYLTISSGNFESCYQANKYDLIQIWEERDGINYSNIILQLSGKIWASDKISLLYDIAEITQKSFPLNKINWEETFYQVAFGKYIDGLELGRSQNDDLLKSVINTLKFSNQESAEIELMSNLKQGVVEELKKRGIVE